MTRTLAWTLFGVTVLLAATVARLRCPVPGARITSRFGPRVRDGRLQEHNGVDLAAPIGTPVLAVGDGEIIGTGDHPAGGRQLFLRLDSGMIAGHAHLQEYTATAGRVKAGQQIATVGNTGRSTGPHLHFTLRNLRGQYVDPLQWIRSC